MLRIDETSKTLVAPPAGGLVTEVSPDRDEMLALVSSSWEAFAGELGQPSLRFVGQGQVPGLDLLAFDEQAGRAVVVGVASEVADAQLTHALSAAAVGRRRWTPPRSPPSTSRCRPPSPATRRRSCCSRPRSTPSTLATVDWLTRRHGLEISCFVLSVFRFGAERLLSIRREYPARDVARPGSRRRGPADARRRGANGEAELAANGHSTPPPAV